MGEIRRHRLDPDRKRKKKKTAAPSSNGELTRDARTGRFLPGNCGGPGNPHAARVSRMRSILWEVIDEESLRQLVRQLLKRALKLDSATGNTAAKLLIDRVIGRSPLDAEEQAIQNAVDNKFDPDERFV